MSVHSRPAAVVTGDMDWRELAACRGDADLFFDTHIEAQRWARHICRAHCPVIDDCHSKAQESLPAGGVWGGQVYALPPNVLGPVRYQPNDPGCGQWCAHLRVCEDDE